jgi:protein-disulfide isomerase-like protein with CxxC motif
MCGWCWAVRSALQDVRCKFGYDGTGKTKEHTRIFLVMLWVMCSMDSPMRRDVRNYRQIDTKSRE